VETDDQDKLNPGDFVAAAGGEWYGLLFDNPSRQLPPNLTWCFNFPFEDVSRKDEDSPLSLTMEWLPVSAGSWRRFAGHHVTSTRFGKPAEASIYYYLHHRFNAVTLDLVEQRSRSLRAVATVSGDIDRLGIDPVHADAWLTFTGILVSLHDVTSPDIALSRLSQFTDTDGLALDTVGSDAGLRFTTRD
jgi:hypothetical protein